MYKKLLVPVEPSQVDHTQEPHDHRSDPLPDLVAPPPRGDGETNPDPEPPPV